MWQGNVTLVMIYVKHTKYIIIEIHWHCSSHARIMRHDKLRVNVGDVHKFLINNNENICRPYTSANCNLACLASFCVSARPFYICPCVFVRVCVIVYTYVCLYTFVLYENKECAGTDISLYPALQNKINEQNLIILFPCISISSFYFCMFVCVCMFLPLLLRCSLLLF